MYNSQYEEYYNSLKKGRNYNFKRDNYSYSNWNSGNRNINKNFLSKRIIRDLVGVFLLFIFVLGLKTFSTPKTQMVYNYSKKLVNENYDYGKIIDRVKSLDRKSLEEKALKYIESFRTKITGQRSIEETISKEFVLPANGNITSPYGERKDPITKKKCFHKGIDIDLKENTEVVSSYKGRVTACGEDKELGKYIILDHGQGIETKYAHLNEIGVKKGQAVEKGKVIGKSGNTGKSTGPHLHFEIIYMGENRNPQDYFMNIKE